jgi:sirohydrochlorin ferrochelatase
MLILVAHGTRSAAGIRTIRAIAAAASARIGPIETAFVDVVGPNPAELLAAASGPATIVPAFLASGYHVHADLPARIRESGHRRAVMTPTLGPDPVLADVMADRLIQVGLRPGDDAVVMAAAGSSDPRARCDVREAATQLAGRVGEVHVGYVATGAPRVSDMVSRLRSAGHPRVFIAPYLLARGLFHDRLMLCGANAVAPPLGAHPKVTELIIRRFGDTEGMAHVA